MTDHNELVGQTVEIFEDPITCQDPEGLAVVVEVKGYDPCGADYGLVQCTVKFEGEDEVFYRAVRWPRPGNLSGTARRFPQ